MANEIPNMSLKQATFNQGSFTPVVYTPQAADMNFLANSLAKMEERQEKAAEKQTAVDVALAQVEDKLNPNEKEWFSNYKQNIQKQIQNEIDAGDYGSAIRVATKMAGKTASDSQILDRIKANELYQQASKEVIARTDISKDTKDWWLDTHQYSYKDKKDNKGNIIGGEYSDYNDRPAGQADYVSLSAKAIQLAAPEKDSNTVEKSNHKGSSSDVTNEDGTGKGSSSSVTTSHGKSLSRQWLTEEKLKDVMNGVFAGTPGAKESVIQDRKVSMWKLSKLKKEFNDPGTTSERKKEIEFEAKLYENDLYDQGVLMGEDEYIAKKVNPILHNAAYDWKDKKVSDSYSKDTGSKTDNYVRGGSGGGLSGLSGLPSGFSSGSPVFIDSSGVVHVSWTQYGQDAKTQAAGAAQDACYILQNPYSLNKQQ